MITKKTKNKDMSQGTLFNPNTPSGGTSARPEPGIYEGAQCINVEVSEKFTDIHVELPSGAQVRDRIFHPNPDSPYIYDGETREDAIKREADLANRRLSQYSFIYLNELERNKLGQSATSFQHGMELLAQMINPKLSQKKVSVKLVPGKDKETGELKYTNFAKYPPYIKDDEDKEVELRYSNHELGLLNKYNAAKDVPVEDKPEPSGPLY
jgi:hypothetical protein